MNFLRQQPHQNKFVIVVTLMVLLSITVFSMQRMFAEEGATLVVTVSPTSQTVVRGATATYTATLEPKNGYDAFTTLTMPSCPFGATCLFNGLPPPVTYAIATTKTVSITVQTNAGTQLGTQDFTFGAYTNDPYYQEWTTTLTLTVQDFSVTVSPNAQTVSRGQDAPYSVIVSAQNGFSGTINLSTINLPSGATATWPEGSGGTLGGYTTSFTKSLVITPQSDAVFGMAYPFTVEATSGSFIHSSNAFYTVQNTASPDFSITGDTVQMQFINKENTEDGQADGVGVVTATQNGLSGDITLDAEWLTGDPNLHWTWNGSCSADKTKKCVSVFGEEDADRQCRDGGAGNQCIGDAYNKNPVVITFPVNDSFADWDNSFVLGHTGPRYPAGTTFQFRIKATHATAGTRYFPSDGTYITLTVVDEERETDSSITLVANPDTATVASGATATFPLTLRAGSDYTGTTVNLTSSSCPTNATCEFLEGSNVISSTSLRAVQSKPLSFRIQTQTGTERTPEGPYDVTVAGTDTTDGNIRSSDIVRLTVTEQPDFSITSVTPNPLTLDPNDSGTYTVTISRTGGFAGDVKIDWTAVPTP